jgi:hypothetical protein
MNHLSTADVRGSHYITMLDEEGGDHSDKSHTKFCAGAETRMTLQQLVDPWLFFCLLVFQPF